MNRRQFLQHTTTSLALAALPLPLCAAEPPTGLGFSLYGMKSLPIGDALQACAAIGYRHVELTLMAGFPTEPKLLAAADRGALRELLARHRLSVSGLMENLSLVGEAAGHAQNLERIKLAAELAHALAPEQPPILETVLGGKSADWEASKTGMAARARDWARVAAEHQVTLCLKPHVGSAVNTPERLLWLHRQVSNPFVKLCYDFSHFQVQGMELEATLQPLIGETRFIHLKDAAGDARKVQFLLPGDGRTDYPQYAALLRKYHWRGPLVIEVSAQLSNKAGYDPVAAARRCFTALAAQFDPPGQQPR